MRNATEHEGDLVQPFIRWAGAKRMHTPALRAMLPERVGTYYEPFMGSAALFFAAKPRSSRLSDTASDLVHTFLEVRDRPREVYEALRPWKVDKAMFYEIRAMRELEGPERAARFIYLNKTCWNGLYRVNSQGHFNVPFGRPKSSNVASLANLLACSSALRGSLSIETKDFEEAVSDSRDGDVVFFDPPYVTGHANNGFVDYNETLFTWADQERLARVAKDLAGRGVFVLLTNAEHDSIRSLYEGSTMVRLDRHSTLASKKEHRRKVSELIIQVSP